MDIDVMVKDRVHYLVEVKLSVDRYDVWASNKKYELYGQLNNVEVKKIIVTFYVDERALEVEIIYR